MYRYLEQSIIQTLAYFSVAVTPVTREELYHYLWRTKAPWDELVTTLDRMVATGTIGERWGYYYLPGEEKNVELRRAATVWSDEKILRAKKAVKYLAWIPFLQTILICNSVGREAATKDSDIDLLIIAAPRRLWVVRALSNAVLRLFGLRTYGRHERDRFCLSFFVTNDQLNLGPYRALDEDIHFAFWLHQMISLYDPKNTYEKMLAANTWTNELLPRRKQKVSAPDYRSGLLARAVKRFFEIAWGTLYGEIVEKQAKDIQMMVLKKKMSVINRSDNGLVIKDTIVKLHEHDARASYHQAWVAKQTAYARQN